MKITDVTVTLFEWRDIPKIQYGPQNVRISGAAKLGLVTIRTDEGIEGHAFLGSAMRGADLDVQSLIAVLKPEVMGQDPLAREFLFKRLTRRYRSTTLRAIGAIDVALWDIAGKAAGQPIYRLMGGFRDSVPAYASSPALYVPDAYAEQAIEVKEAGYHAYKIHPPTRWEEDIKVCAATRAAVGDDYKVMLDATWSYRYDEALRVGRAIEDLGFYWYEDPLAEEDIYNYVKLKQQLHIPLMATEWSPGGFHAYAPWIIASATDYLRGDVAVKGGLTGCLKAAHLADGFRMNFEIHHGGNSLNNVANIHLMCAIPNSEFFEVLLPDAAQKHGLVEDLALGPDGMIAAPTRPGLGVEIDFKGIESTTIAVLS
jgi:L-alanine-DL-glutamate epimerase-like enolase superfamily enzyme